jgi:hypothetical protein
MAQLSSPGVSVSVIDESFYTSAAPGTTPLIIIASEQDKANGSSTGTALGTTQANAGKVYLLTSQKDLADTFGTPVFKTDANNNPIHAGEQNEYGLQAAYSYLGVSNRAYVVRADLDLAQLEATSAAPTGAPENGTYWFDSASTKFGIFQWNGGLATTTSGQTFGNKIPTVITDSAQTDAGVPKANIGQSGDYAIVATTQVYSLFFKKAKTDTDSGAWVKVGSDEWAASWPTIQGTSANPTLSAGDSIIINGTSIAGHTGLATLVSDINGAATPGQTPPLDPNSSGIISGITAAIINGRLELYSTGADIIVSGTLCAALGIVAGTYKAPKLQISAHTSVPQWKRSLTTYNNNSATGSVWIKTTEPNLGSRWRVKVYNATTKAWEEKTAPLYSDAPTALKGLDPTGGGINLAQGTLYVKYNLEEDGANPVADFRIQTRKVSGPTIITSKSTFTAFNWAGTAAKSVVIGESVKGQSYTTRDSAGAAITFSVAETDTIDIVITKLLNAVQQNSTIPGGAGRVAYTSRITAENIDGRLVIKHLDGGEIYLEDVSPDTVVNQLFGPAWNGTTGTLNFYEWPTAGATGDSFVASNWTPFNVIKASASAPTTEPVADQLWYSSMVDEVDIMVHNGTTWKGYRTVYSTTDPKGPIVRATKPVNGDRSDGGNLVDNDLWIDTSDLENYPTLYKWNNSTKKWIMIDTADQTTQDGIIFADARWAEAGKDIAPATIQKLVLSDFLDPDAPDPALYPQGMLLWNLRRSGFNVKRFVRDYIDLNADNARYNNEAMGGAGPVIAYYPHRWVTESGNQVNGSGTFGRKAQRKVVIQALQALVNSNQEMRDEESRVFNLLACPGYPELIGEMINLNYDRGLTSFVVGDTPARLTPDATSLNNWGKNVAGAVEDNDDGLVSSDEYFGVFYPWGYTSDNIGNNIVVPPSHMILRTIALNDQVSYPWFAPAGTRRGGITNASAVGYITSEGEFQSVSLNTGQRDTLADSKINPITFITGTGLVNYGQYTRAKNASSLDRINVARLVIYLRRQFALLAKPYVFEPNDKITRDELKGAAESLLLELVGQRALYDYIVVCDTSNNTPARIDRNELYLDVAIEPVKAVEFIYIPLRLKNTGEIKGLA